jgi:hypothetical protein
VYNCEGTIKLAHYFCLKRGGVLGPLRELGVKMR